jgi:hypothetical protein
MMQIYEILLNKVLRAPLLFTGSVSSIIGSYESVVISIIEQCGTTVHVCKKAVLLISHIAISEVFRTINTKIGYEISFNKYFYQHKSLRSLEEVTAEMLQLRMSLGK